ncbi:hypothetical protein LOD99_1626 [Oopsacas minuta]|uniref:RZZ complex subunit KNTC1/ROD C-terminal domain-containing protein n=1 Tax=Oopsacas minuta TaxID=111878 RepID=A0AAV7K3R2_9METZ|nr:hypothetical protein LOD99_1626 [Oopsacas minuta]
MLGDDNAMCIRVTPSVPLRIESSPMHSTFQSYSSVTMAYVDITCISEHNQTHVWLGHNYSKTLFSDDVILLTQLFFDPVSCRPTIFMFSHKTVYWFVCTEDNQWDLAWHYPSSQRVYSISTTFDRNNETYTINLLFRDKLHRITGIKMLDNNVVFDFDNAKHQDFVVTRSTKIVDILNMCCLEDQISICTVATLSLHNLTGDSSISTCYTPNQDICIKYCMFVTEIGLIILLTQTGEIQFIDSYTLTLCDEWINEKYNSISLLDDEELYYLVCHEANIHELRVISLSNLETVAACSLPDISTFLVSSNSSDQFCYYSFDNDSVLTLYHCRLEFVSKEVDLEKTMVNFSLMQACMDHGFDWVTEIVDNINDSKFQTACFLLWKHYDSIQYKVTVNIFILFLDNIPKINHLEGVILWLKSLLLFISLHNDSKKNFFAQMLEWTEGYIVSLEKHFPEKWIQLSLKLVQFLNSQIYAIDAWEANKRLALIQNQIQDIEIVFNTLNIRLSFSRISEYSLSSFLHELLRHAHSSEQIRSLLTSKIISIVNRHGESLDNVLYKYIRSLDGKLNQEIYLAELLESKAMAVISFISSNELKHESTIFLLTHAKLPTSKKLIEFAIEVENSTRRDMQHEIELTRVLSILRDVSIDIPALHSRSRHQMWVIIPSLQANTQSTERITTIAKYGDISDHILAYILHSSQLLSLSFEEDPYSKLCDLLPLVLQALINAENNFAESELLLDFLNKLRHHYVSQHNIVTNASKFYTNYFDDLFKGVYLYHHLKDFENGRSIPFLINSQSNTDIYSQIIPQIPNLEENETCLTSPLKKMKLSSDPMSIFKNLYQLSKFHRRQIWDDLMTSALELSNITCAILLIKLRIQKEGFESEESISILFPQILSKFPQILSELEEPVHTLTQLEQIISSYIPVVAREKFVDLQQLLLKIRLIKDIMFQSEFEIKPKLNQQQLKESRRLFRNHSYQEKGYILDKSSTTNCISSLSKADYVISPRHSASILATLKNLFLPQTSLCYLLLTLYSIPTLIISPTLHNIPGSLLTSLLRNSPIDVTYGLSLLLCLSDDEAKKELIACHNNKTSSPSWFLSVSWIVIYYLKLVELDSFKSYAIKALSIGQYVTYIRSVTKQKIDIRCTEWTPEYIISKLNNPIFSPVHILRVAELFSLNTDNLLLGWIKSAVHDEWDVNIIKDALCLLEARFESLYSLYQSGETASFNGIKFILDSILQLQQSSDYQPLLHKAVCLVNFLISSQAPFLTKSLSISCDASLLATNQLTFNDLLGDDPWSLIKDFLTFQYLNIYLGLTAYLNILRDHLISNTIKAEVTKSTSQEKSLCFQQVKQYLEQLGTREIQIAASKWLGSNMQHIEDKMKAILFAIESANQWKNETTVVAEIQKACEAQEKLQNFYNMLKVEAWLSELGINEDNTPSNLYQHPRELIRVLTTSYLPETIYQCTKLYQIITDICSIFSLDIDTVISDSISSLISNQKELKSLNDSFSFCIERDLEEMDVSLDITSNIYTQLIVLLSGDSVDIDLHVNNLINIAIRDTKSHSYSNRKAALQLAIILISHHSSHKITFNEFVLDILTQIAKQFDSPSGREDNLLSLHLLLELLCVVEDLELLGYPMGIGTFLQSSKLSVIQGLVRNFADSAQAFELSARISMLLCSKVSDTIWQEILEKLCNYKRYSFLLSILPTLTNHISSDFITPLTFKVLTQIPLTQHTNLFPHFIQLAHSLPELTPILKQEFISSTYNFVKELKAIGEESYAQILEHLVQSQDN